MDKPWTYLQKNQNKLKFLKRFSVERSFKRKWNLFLKLFVINNHYHFSMKF